MAVNRDKTHLWKEDTAASVDQFNQWFMESAPKAFRDTRVKATQDVENTLKATSDFAAITAAILRDRPSVLPTLRMACCPPLAVDRLIGLSAASKNLVGNMEGGRLPRKMAEATLLHHLNRLIVVFDKMLDRDIFPWLADGKRATAQQRHCASTRIADRHCSATASAIVRIAQKQRQKAKITSYLTAKGYRQEQHDPALLLTEMEQGTFWSGVTIVLDPHISIKVSIDVVIQPKARRPSQLPIFVEMNSGGDLSTPNKRLKGEAMRAQQLREGFGADIEFVLFLCGYIDASYLGYAASESIDWVWEHRIHDFALLGI